MTTAKQAQRTPGPWRATRTNGTARYWSIVDQHGGCVATTEYGKHAETIVARYNAHDDLVAALRDVVEFYTADKTPDAAFKRIQVMDRARAVLAKVEAS